MDGYMCLSPEQSRSIRVGRIRQLEEEHFGALLLLEENGKDQATINLIGELERRIQHHVQILSGETAEQRESARPELPVPAEVVTG